MPSARPAGFTLLELLVVIGIVVVLFAFGLAVVRGARERTAIARAKAELALLGAALEQYQRQHGDYPQAGASLPGSQVVNETAGPDPASAQARLFAALSGQSAGFVELSTLGLERVGAAGDRLQPNAFLDPWGRRYLYFYRTSGATAAPWIAPGFVLFSAGPDGETGALPDSTGVFPPGTQDAERNADNIYADALP